MIKKMLEINQSISNINDRFSTLEQFKQNYLNYKDNISEIYKSITEINNSINEFKENNSKEINNKIEQLNETINNIYNTKSIYSITTLQNINEKQGFSYQLNSISTFESNQIIVVYERYLMILEPNFNNNKTFFEHSDQIYYVDIFDEKNFATCSLDKSIKTWIKNNNEYSINETIYGAHDKKITKVIYNSKGNLISCSWDGFIKIWELKNGEYKNITNLNHTDKVTSFLLLEDKNILISSGNGIKFWNLTNNEIIFSDNNTNTTWNTGLDKIDDDRIIVCNNTINKIINGAHREKITKVIYNSKGNLIFCSWDGLIKIWELKNGEYIKILQL